MDAQRLFKRFLARNERAAACTCDFCGLAGDVIPKRLFGTLNAKIKRRAHISIRVVKTLHAPGQFLPDIHPNLAILK